MKKLIDKITRFLKQPHGRGYHPLYTTVVVTLLVLFVLAIFEPFGIANASRQHYFIVLFLSAVGTATGIMLPFFFVPFLFKNYFDLDNWTIGKDMVLSIIAIFTTGICNGLLHGAYFYWSGDHSVALFWHVFSNLFIATVLVSPIPVIVLSVLNHNKLLKSSLKQAQALNLQLMKRSMKYQSTPEKPYLVLSGATKESIELIPANLLYIEAYGNYIKVNFRDADGHVRQKMLRSTIKQMEEAFNPYPFVIRCHRAFLVNTQAIVSVSGNSQGYHLTFQDIEDEVPVSRAYTKALKEQIEQQ